MLPPLKNPGLDFAFKNFRPVSNLFYISKLSEKAGAQQFMEHLTANDVHSHLQMRMNSKITRRRPYSKLRMVF